MDADELKRRAYAVARGLGLEAPPAHMYYYHPPHPIGSLETQLDICHLLDEYHIDVIGLDSLTIGSSGSDVSDSSDAVSLMQKINDWGTVVAIDHMTKAGALNQSSVSIFGSTFKRAIARSTIKATKAVGGGITLSHDKHNFGEKSQPLHFAIDFDTEGKKLSIDFRRLDEADEEMVGGDRHLSAHEQTYHALKRLYEGFPVAIETLAGELDKSDGTIRNHITVLKRGGRVQLNGDGTVEPATDSRFHDPLGVVNREWREGDEVVADLDGLKIPGKVLSAKGKLIEVDCGENNLMLFKPSQLQRLATEHNTDSINPE